MNSSCSSSAVFLAFPALYFTTERDQGSLIWSAMGFSADCRESSAYLLAVLTGPDSPIQYTAHTIYAVMPVRWRKFWADHLYHFKLVFDERS